MERIEVVLEGRDRTQKAFAEFRKNVETSVGELRKAKAEIFAYSSSIKNAIQWQQMSAKEYVRATSQLREYDKYVARLTTQIPRNQQEQARWVKAIKEGLNPIQQYIKNFDEIAPLLDNVSRKALDFNNTLIQTTGFVKKGSAYTLTLAGRIRRLAHSFTEMKGPLYKAGRVFNHYLPIFFVGVYAFRNLQQQLDRLTKSFADFESQLVVVERTTGMAHETVSRLGGVMLDLTTIMPAAISELEEVAITAGRLGITGEANITKFTDAVIKMANATVLSADQAANSMARIAKAMGIPIENVNYLGSMIDRLANTAAANAEQITTAMKRAAGASKVLGIPAEALAAMATTLIEAGDEAARTGTRLSRAFTYASIKTAVMARQMGVSVSELRKRMEEDMLAVWLDYLKMLKDTPSKTERLAKAHEVFGMIGSKAIIKLANNYDTLVKHIEDAHEDMLTGITLEREFAKALDTTTAKLQMLDNQIEATKIRLGEKLAPVTMAMKKITLGFYETLAGPEPKHYGEVITDVSERVAKLLKGEMDLTEGLRNYHTELTEQFPDLYARYELINAIAKTELKEYGILDRLRVFIGLLNEEEKKRYAVYEKLSGITERNIKNWLAQADVITKGAASQMYFNDAVYDGTRAFAKYGAIATRANAVIGSLTKSLIESGLASDELRETWDELGDALTKRQSLIKTIVELQSRWGNVTERISDLEYELNDVMEGQLKTIDTLLSANEDLAETYYDLNDALAYLNGQYPTFQSLTRGVLAVINDTIVPIELLDKGFLKLGDVIPKKYLTPLRALLEQHKKVIDSYQELQAAEMQFGPGSEKVVDARALFREELNKYISLLGEASPVITELNAKELEWGLTESKRYTQLKASAIMTQEELELYKSEIDATADLRNSYDRLKEIRAEITELTGAQNKAEKMWNETLGESFNTVDAFERVLTKLGITEEEDRKRYLKRVEEIIKGNESEEERNKLIIDYIAVISKVTGKEEELENVNARINELRKEGNKILLENLEFLTSQGFISGKVADDMRLLINAATDLGSVTEEDRKAMNDMVAAFLWMGAETGDIKGALDSLGEGIESFGLKLEYTPEIAEGAMKDVQVTIKDSLGNVLVDTSKWGDEVHEIISGVPEDVQEEFKRIGFRWETVFGKGKVLELAYTAPIEDVFRQQLVELSEISDNTKRIAERGISKGSMQIGGVVRETGLYTLHAGELVIPKKAGVSHVMNINIEHVSLSPEYSAERFLKDLEAFRFSATI